MNMVNIKVTDLKIDDIVIHLPEDDIHYKIGKIVHIVDNGDNIFINCSNGNNIRKNIKDTIFIIKNDWPSKWETRKFPIYRFCDKTWTFVHVLSVDF
mgnify:CR=1 FL=1